MKPDITLKFDGGYLKCLNVSDIHQAYVDGLNDPNVNLYLDAPRHKFQTLDSVTNFVSENIASLDGVLWGIWLDDAKNHVGTLRIHGVEPRHKTAYIGVCLFDREAWGRGIGSKSIKAVTKWAIKSLDIRWLEAGILTKNIASQKAFLSAGYAWSYNIPGKYIYDGMPTDVKIYVAKDINQ